ncbi:MAG: ATP-binding protein [Saprospiraceae bacterium]|nr:ATP-binding protein [Saprospiraceae bacterium]
MIPRSIADQVRNDLFQSQKVVIIYGPRQVGKTTLVRQLIRELTLKSLEVNADQIRYHEAFAGRDLSKMQAVIGDAQLLFLDEAQNIPDIGINLKILHDSLPGLKIIATGSSSFELANRLQEPLTGRTWTYSLYPIAVQELATLHTPFELAQQTESFLRFGMYPDVLQAIGDEAKIRQLRELASAYLYKDVLQLSSIKHADKLVRLLKLLAFQAGSPVSLHELGKSLEMNHETVNSYIDLLEKGFIVFRLSAFSRNLRKEVTKMSKVYFYDTGIRNSLIDNFNPLELRHDTGALWENFLVAERRKKVEYQRLFGSAYYWRTYSGAELDYVEERAGQLLGFEFKWKNTRAKAPATWFETYPQSTFECIHRDNFLEFVG